MTSYPRELRPGQQPFDPIEVSIQTEKIVSKKIKNSIARKYTHFSVVRYYQRSATAFAVGCNLRCFFCWSHRARDYPEHYGEFYTPSQVVEKLERLAQSKGTTRARISGGEPTIVFEHLIQVLKLIEESKKIDLFVLETNGILLGYNRAYVKELAKVSSKLIVRVSIKAGLPDRFTHRTGAKAEYFEYPFKAIEHLIEEGVSVYVAIVSDPRIVDVGERRAIISKLASIDPRLVQEVEEETIEAFPESIRRMKIYGVVLK